jgi:phosphoribosylaminoimidazole-succinocarboxamide synthase
MINFIRPLLRRTTKADNGEHDADISRENILSKVSEEDYLVLKNIPETYFKRN